MPFTVSTYKPSIPFKNTHVNTVYKTLFYKNIPNYHRIRIPTLDDDFLDLDFSTVGSETLVLAMHGLEGSSKSPYMVSVIRYLNSQNIDGVALNFRGCSGTENNQLYSYHSGKTDDLELTINYLVAHYSYKNIILLGYSMGGNITLKYMGEKDQMHAKIKGGIAISAPCDLKGSSYALEKWQNSIYMNRFLKTLKEKTLLKLKKFPKNNLDKEAILKSKSFKDFDNAVTAPLFNYKNAEDYWGKCSSKQFIVSIKKPTLLLSALDDSFLSESCYPINEAKNHPYFKLELSKYGGHVGFNTSIFKKDLCWSEKQILDFIKHIIS